MKSFTLINTCECIFHITFLFFFHPVRHFKVLFIPFISQTIVKFVIYAMIYEFECSHRILPILLFRCIQRSKRNMIEQYLFFIHVLLIVLQHVSTHEWNIQLTVQLKTKNFCLNFQGKSHIKNENHIDGFIGFN